MRAVEQNVLTFAFLFMRPDYDVFRFNDTFSVLAVGASSITEVALVLNTSYIPYEVVATDFQKIIDTENPPKEVLERLQSRNCKGFADDIGNFVHFSAAHRQ